MKKIFLEPLIHFLLIGALLFIVFELFGSSNEESGTTITITSGDISILQGTFTRTWQRPPSEKELDGLIEDKVREKIAYLEATALGLDQEDPYIRRRLRMKMELLVEDLAASAPPADEELQEYLERNRETFREDTRIAFTQVYLDPTRRSESLDEEVGELLIRLETFDEQQIPENYGDTTMLPTVYQLTRAEVIDRQFGRGFADAVAEMEPGTWQGPVASSYGLHLVRLDEIVEGYDPALDDIRAVVERELMTERRRVMLENTYDRLRQKYTVVIESPVKPE
jgi:hypothetical protein